MKNDNNRLKYSLDPEQSKMDSADNMKNIT
jgi:hypothetical protein